VNHERIFKTLASLGLSGNDAKIYLYLTAKGRRRAEDIAKELNLPKHQVYNSLRRLREQDTVHVNCEKITTFSAQSFEKIMNSYVRIKLHEAKEIDDKRMEILSNWRKIISSKEQKER
jgi:sugar-specific transcriptional regulator TrmB